MKDTVGDQFMLNFLLALRSVDGIEVEITSGSCQFCTYENSRFHIRVVVRVR